MLTICIPIYNLNTTKLIEDLSLQARKQKIVYEIIIIDDCSLEKYKIQNELVAKQYTYIELSKNIGRAKIRNKFLEFANYNNLLFLDCDSTIISNNYIATYVKEILKTPNYHLFFGGSIYQKTKPARNKRLRWKYGVFKESQPIEIRKRTPNKSFMTNNFLINKKVFEKVRFDERITKYGHEDTLFGYTLKKYNYKVKHIDNSVLNENLEDNYVYLNKIETSTKNLIAILNYVDNDSDLIKNVSLLKFYNKMQKKKLLPVLNVLFILTKPTLKLSFIKGFINLKLFDFYKLGILMENYKTKKTSI